MPTREERLEIIQQIEDLRSSRVLVYVTSDRAGAPAQIGDDAVRHLDQHLREFGHSDNLDLLIYSRGGATDVPWRIVSTIRNTSNRWSVLIPYRANSAATMVALGADEVLMGPQARSAVLASSVALFIPGLPR